jgi:asparagine synthase (glutamine-hydrolysing)
MSGIAGIFHLETAKPVEESRVRAMLDPMRHRGPDGSDVWMAPGVGLGHLRLSVIDPAGGAQPMASDDGQIAVTCDGAIYNFAQLRAELEAKGHRFTTRSDSEVILHGWRQWGEACVDHLQGIFAFVLHDRRTQSLWLVRDRLGVKPLHYAQLSDGSLIFASELKGLLSHPLMRREPELSAVEDYLAYGYVPDDSAILRGVSKLGAGEALLAVRGRPLSRPARYWDVSFADRSPAKGGALEEELVDLLRQSVRSRMVADVPVGALLSGGVDSSTVVAFMAEASPEAVRTSTLGLENASLDESAHADLIARRYATDHRSRAMPPGEPMLVDTLAAHFDEPFADSSAPPAYRLCQLAREHMTVALGGDGVDEAFAGHHRHMVQLREARIRAFLPSFLRGAALAPLTGLVGDGAEAYAASVAMTPPEQRQQLWADDARAALGGYRAEDRYIKAMRDAPARDALDRAQYADLRIALPGNTLTRIDRMSMAAGLEAREPLLDHRLVEFAARLPVAMRIRGRTGKYLMKKAMERHLPQAILYRSKMRLATPVSAWFRGTLAGEARALAGGSALARTGWFDMPGIARIAEQHRSGSADHGQLLWQLLMLDRSLAHLFGLR